MPSLGSVVHTDPAVALRFLQCWLVGNIMGATAYGISLTLSWNCLILLARPTQTTSMRMRRVMMALIGFMCTLSTIAFILATGGVVRWSANPSAESILAGYSRVWGEPYSPVELILIVLATWFSDGFMIWRCIMLYEGVSRLARIAVMTFVTLLTMASFAIGLCALITFTPVKWQIYSILSLFELISLVANGSIAFLIIVRIIYHQRFLRKVFGSDYGSAYTKIMSILIESASLTLVLSLVHIILAAAYGRASAADSPANMIIIKLITQINTISPTLIIFRVAQGRTWQDDPTKSLKPFSNELELGQLKSLKFVENDAFSTRSTLDEHCRPHGGVEKGSAEPTTAKLSV